MKRNRYPSDSAFVEPSAKSGQENNRYLSVNNLEIERMRVIADYYRNVLKKDAGRVAIAIHNVAAYNSNGRKAGVGIQFNKELSVFEFLSSSGNEPAYRHRPGRSESHCGVEFIRAFDELAERKFSRRMARRRFQLT